MERYGEKTLSIATMLLDFRWCAWRIVWHPTIKPEDSCRVGVELFTATYVSIHGIECFCVMKVVMIQSFRMQALILTREILYVSARFLRWLRINKILFNQSCSNSLCSFRICVLLFFYYSSRLILWRFGIEAHSAFPICVDSLLNNFFCTACGVIVPEYPRVSTASYIDQKQSIEIVVVSWLRVVYLNYLWLDVADYISFNACVAVGYVQDRSQLFAVEGGYGDIAGKCWKFTINGTYIASKIVYLECFEKGGWWRLCSSTVRTFLLGLPVLFVVRMR